MTRFALTAVFMSASTAAMAHPGHVEAASGHDHYAAVVAIAVAAAVSIYSIVKARKSAAV